MSIIHLQIPQGRKFPPSASYMVLYTINIETKHHIFADRCSYQQKIIKIVNVDQMQIHYNHKSSERKSEESQLCKRRNSKNGTLQTDALWGHSILSCEQLPSFSEGVKYWDLKGM